MKSNHCLLLTFFFFLTTGKTSLISVAANLIASQDDIAEGEIRINGDVGKLPKRLVGVVWQDDLLLSNLTVEETIYFPARLKTPCEVPEENVRALVEATMKELGLLHVRDSLIGSAISGQRGISGGERKRVAVASELVVQPSLLLLDEPTSGKHEMGTDEAQNYESHVSDFRPTQLLPNEKVWTRQLLGVWCPP